MRNNFGVLIAVALVVIIAVLGSASLYTVGQNQQALVLRLGEAIPGKALVTAPGLHAKVPFIETVTLLDRRILDLETPKQEVLASDNNRIEVDAFLRYRIVDALRFYQTVGTIQRANNQLGSVLSSALRRVLGEATMVQIIREGRSTLMVSIRDLVNTEATRLGVEVIDVRIRRADLPKQISDRVFDRMRTERAREAAEFRAQGSGNGAAYSRQGRPRRGGAARQRAAHKPTRREARAIAKETGFSPRLTIRTLISSHFTGPCKLTRRA